MIGHKCDFVTTRNPISYLSENFMVSLSTTTPMTNISMLLWEAFKHGNAIQYLRTLLFIVVMDHLNIWRVNISLKKTCKVEGILKQFPYVIKYKKGNNNIIVGTPYFQNWKPKFLDFIAYLSFMHKTLTVSTNVKHVI